MVGFKGGGDGLDSEEYLFIDSRQLEAAVMEDATATQQQQWRWMAPWRRNGDDGDGWRDGDVDGHGY